MAILVRSIPVVLVLCAAKAFQPSGTPASVAPVSEPRYSSQMPLNSMDNFPSEVLRAPSKDSAPGVILEALTGEVIREGAWIRNAFDSDEQTVLVHQPPVDATPTQTLLEKLYRQEIAKLRSGEIATTGPTQQDDPGTAALKAKIRALEFEIANAQRGLSGENYVIRRYTCNDSGVVGSDILHSGGYISLIEK